MKHNNITNTFSSRNLMNSIGFVLGWFSIIGQFVLMMQNRQADVAETIIRFFSFFTILTNLLVVLYFTSRISSFQNTSFFKLFGKGSVTALTAFILVVGLVYQIILRSTWKPTGFQIIIDELLHSLIPLFVLIYWIKFVTKQELQFQNLKNWLWYPALYFVYIIVRGYFSNFYPYPFINVSEIGYFKVFINFIIISIFFLCIMGILIFIGNKINNNNK